MGELSEEMYDPLAVASREYFERAIPAGEYVAWLASPAGRPGEIIAGAGVQVRPLLPRPSGHGHAITRGRQGLIVNVYTEKAWRRQGLAKLLMRNVLDWSRANGVASLVLHASADGRALYEKLGFVATNEMRYTGEL